MNQVVTGSLTTGGTNDAERFSTDLLESASPGSEAVNAPSTDPEESILARYFGIVPALPRITGNDPQRGYYLRKQAIATDLERRSGRREMPLLI